MKLRTVAMALGAITSIVASVLIADSPASATTRSYPTIHAVRHSVLQNDHVELYGRGQFKYVRIYRRVGYGHFHYLRSVRVRAGHYHVRVRPVAGRTNHYRAGRRAEVVVHSVGCTPLSTHGSVRIWFQDESRVNTLANRWARMICSAAPHSIVNLAAMFVYDDGPDVSRIVSALRKVHRYRHVSVRVLVQRAKYHSTSASWSRLRQVFSFATLHYCWRSCHSDSDESHMHDKFTTVSRTVFGGSAVLEVTANMSKKHLEGQRSSGVYVYNNSALTDAYHREWRSLVDRTPQESAGWVRVGRNIAYSFDPHSTAADPVTNELAGLHCVPGDFIDVVNADITRYRLIEELNRLRAAGCDVRAVREFSEPTPSIQFPVRRTHLHDKFIVVDAHNAAGHVREVLTGSEDYRTTSMTLSDQQLLRLRRSDAYWAFRYHFGHLWAVAG